MTVAPKASEVHQKDIAPLGFGHEDVVLGSKLPQHCAAGGCGEGPHRLEGLGVHESAKSHEIHESRAPTVSRTETHGAQHSIDDLRCVVVP